MQILFIHTPKDGATSNNRKQNQTQKASSNSKKNFRKFFTQNSKHSGGNTSQVLRLYNDGVKFNGRTKLIFRFLFAF